MPKAFTKQAAARALVKANMESATTIESTRNGFASKVDWKKAWKIINSLTKPLNGGNAEIETAPIRNSNAVLGIRLIKPPMSSMFFVSVELITEPVVMNRRLLKTAWLNEWNSEPNSASMAMLEP